MKALDGRIIHLSVEGNIPYLVDGPNERIVLLAVGGELEAPPPPLAHDEDDGAVIHPILKFQKYISL